jgi:hypothetical protein
MNSGKASNTAVAAASVSNPKLEQVAINAFRVVQYHLPNHLPLFKCFDDRFCTIH